MIRRVQTHRDLFGPAVEPRRLQQFLLLKVPSFIIAENSNPLINPLHPEAAQISIVQKRPFTFDERLWQPYGALPEAQAAWCGAVALSPATVPKAVIRVLVTGRWPMAERRGRSRRHVTSRLRPAPQPAIPGTP